jgi:hypothetical protein
MASSGRPADFPRYYEPEVLMKRDATFFEGKEAVLVYIARKLNDALRLESLFTGSGVDYGVEADHYTGGVIFRRQRAGAFFYVLPESVAAAHEVMRANGYAPYSELG